ncbi:hypothetical protein [Pleionea sediminis]|uniref:hypothetical protein n=1 Tax=Pleionea sediminis TaxID=2569479 RepID=UPI001185BB4B|nr:hypothetical protein [Pleionea sediminis]
MLKIILGLFFTVTTLQSVSKSKYENYIFQPNYSNVINEFNKPDALSKFVYPWYEFRSISYLSTNKNEFVLFGVDVADESVNELMKLRKDSKKNLRVNYFDSGGDAFVINSSDGIRIEFGPSFSGDLISTGHKAHDYFGCIESKPIFEASMIKDNGSSVWVITGMGNNLPYAGVIENIKVSVYDGQTTEKYFEYYAMIASYIDEPWRDFDYVLGETRNRNSPLFNESFRGKKLFSKVFIDDFNKDDRLDVIIWHRQYHSTLVSDKDRKGFIFEKEWYTHYEEKDNSFVKKEMTVEAGTKLLESVNLTWKDGFPKGNSLCDGREATVPMMPLVIDPRFAY